jgi:hypothetical protein
MNQQREAAEAEYAALNSIFLSGNIAASSKKELERFAIALSRPHAPAHFGASSYPQICETVRTLLIVRMSEEQNEQAKRESRLALIIASVALLAGLVQAVASLWPLIVTSPTLVRAARPLPVLASEPLGVHLTSPRPVAPQASAVFGAATK